jgi:hypothetical protein
LTFIFSETGLNQDGIENLADVRSIQASAYSFAAILGNGGVVTWGHQDFGGDSTAIQEQ